VKRRIEGCGNAICSCLPIIEEDLTLFFFCQTPQQGNESAHAGRINKDH
jgi:hypothetical protein